MNRLDLALALIAVADHGSVLKAAESLHQTDAAISRKITKLEAYLGIKLISREKSGAVLTEAGQHYYHDMKLAIKQFHEAENLIKAKTEKPQGKLTVASNAFYTKYFILPKLNTFLKTYPDIDLTLDVAEVLPNFKKKSMDILFGVSFPGEDHLVRKKIDDFRRILCASPTYLKKHGTPKTPAELLQHQFIAHSSRENPSHILLNEELSLEIRPTLHINQSECITEAALQNLGIIWTPDSFVHELLQKKKQIESLPHYIKEKLPSIFTTNMKKSLIQKLRRLLIIFNVYDFLLKPSFLKSIKMRETYKINLSKNRRRVDKIQVKLLLSTLQLTTIKRLVSISPARLDSRLLY